MPRLLLLQTPSPMRQCHYFSYCYYYYYIYYLLIYSMEQNPSWEANRCSGSQEITRISRNSEVHYRIQKRPPRVTVWMCHDNIRIYGEELLALGPSPKLEDHPFSTLRGICRHNTDDINIGTRYVILAKHYMWLPDDGLMWTEKFGAAFIILTVLII
jgi:hypothetical protein